MARYVPNEFKVFECGRCTRHRQRTLRRTNGDYNGTIILSPKVQVRHQEVWGRP